MARSWFDWLTGKSDTVDRRETVPAAVSVPSPADYDPLTGALRWERFLPLLEAEQAQAPGVMLIVDLAEHSHRLATSQCEDKEVLPLLASAIRQSIRVDDLLAHVEGHRFAALLRGASEEYGEAIKARVLESVENTIFLSDNGLVNLDVVVGSAPYSPLESGNLMSSAMSQLPRQQDAD
jgi:GGDEF domain-containing protein